MRFIMKGLAYCLSEGWPNVTSGGYTVDNCTHLYKDLLQDRSALLSNVINLGMKSP